MRLLVDECCNPRLVAALRSAGHDVRYALESDRGAADEALLALSVADRRVLITEDKDFGERTLRSREPVPGLILLRVGPENRHRKPELMVALLARYGEQLRNSLAVVDEFGARLRPRRRQLNEDLSRSAA